jgi:hypothetical protein
MNAKVRRSFDMGTAVRTFGRTHPVESPEFVLIMGDLEGALDRIVALDGQQRAGLLDRHAGAMEVRKLVATMRSVHLPHLAQAGQKAARTEHELGTTFRVKPAHDSLAGFQTAAATMVAEAKRHQEVLVKAGLSPAVLSDLEQTLAALGAAAEMGKAARASHIGASAEMKVLRQEVVRQVRLLDAVNRLAFRNSPELLAAWQAVSRVRATPAPAGKDEGKGTDGSAGSLPPVPGNDVRPAA